VTETAPTPAYRAPSEICFDGVPAGQLEEWLATMIMIREFEDALEPLSTSGNQIPGGVHQASGQEGVAVGAIRALEAHDVVASPHRPHHHALAKGLTPRSVMAELWGRATGCAGGRGGTMHLSDFSLGYYGSNGIVGASLGIALGAALAAKVRRTGQVCVGCFGEGAANTGRTWEFINFAALHRLPLIALCENNQYAVETSIDRAAALERTIASRADGFGLPASQVDGQDPCAVYRAVREARGRAAAGEGPTFIEALTYRHHGHNTGETPGYRPEQEIEYWRDVNDPIHRLSAALIAAGQLDRTRYDAHVAAAKDVVADAIHFAETSVVPDPASATDGVTAIRSDPRGPARWLTV
jgi:TPP-dependent pyruvate/acetoin dehydrogenase alpha subunit